MSNIVPFQFDNFTLRTVVSDDGEILFVGKDAAEALGYKDPTTALKSHCRGCRNCTPFRHPVVCKILGLLQNQTCTDLLRDRHFQRLRSGCIPKIWHLGIWPT